MSGERHDTRWFAAGGMFVLFAVVIGVSIGPAGPDWWRVPLELVNRLPWIDFETGVSDADWAIVWKVRMPRVVLGGLDDTVGFMRTREDGEAEWRRLRKKARLEMKLVGRNFLNENVPAA